MWTSTDAAAIIGCSYRQLHYLTASGIKPAGLTGPGGPGSRFLWSEAQVTRLAVAYLLSQVVPDGSFPELAAAALADDTPEPPRSGYALYTTEPMALRWVPTWADVRRIIEDWGSAAIATYDLGDLPALDACTALA